VLWCGNNETEEAFNWGTRWQLPPDVRLRMWQDYLTHFSGILDRVVARLESEIPYWPSSPSSDYETTSENFASGDMHDWGVWHGRVPFTDYEKHLWRFVSEFGFQSFPEMPTIASFTQPEDRTGITTPIMLAHQKNNEGNSIIQDYMKRDYPEPKDFSSLIYVSQVLQAEGIKIGAEHFRRSRPATMGSLFWQLNDCWPVASWSSIDYYGRWKALQYYARRFYAPILVSPHIENGVMKFYAVSDLTAPQPAQLQVSLMDFEGKVLLEDKREVTVAPLMSQIELEWPLDKISVADGGDPSRVFISAKLIGRNGEISRNLIYVAPTKDVHLKPAALTVQASGQNDRFTIRISSPVLARDVYLSFGNLDVQLSDNYFDVLPGESVVVTGSSAASLDEIKAQMRVVSLTDAFAAPAQQPAGDNQKKVGF
jgi:beta-mannosidase